MHICRLNFIYRTPGKSFDDSYIMLYIKIYRFTGFQNKSYNLLVFIDTSLYLHQLFISGNIHLHLIYKLLIKNYSPIFGHRPLLHSDDSCK